jgi:hypothetical protein
MKRTFTFIFFTITLFTSFAQTPGVKWNRTIRTYNDGEALFDVKGTADGGLVMIH